MEPELREGDRLLVDVWTYRHRAPRPTEVVVVAAPGPARTLLVKRAGRRSPVLGPPRPDDPPGGRVWVEGDNPEDSLDSRQLGEIAEDRVAGRVVLRYWPLSRLGLVR
jgi:signal peptidase I